MRSFRTICTGGNEPDAWRRVWQAADVRSQWTVPLEPVQTARFLKIRLQRSGILHLNQVIAFGIPAGK
jgi:hypothetical protein